MTVLIRNARECSVGEDQDHVEFVVWRWRRFVPMKARWCIPLCSVLWLVTVRLNSQIIFEISSVSVDDDLGLFYLIKGIQQGNVTGTPQTNRPKNWFWVRPISRATAGAGVAVSISCFRLSDWTPQSSIMIIGAARVQLRKPDSRHIA
ncbi:hypothetical protein B0H19DRAFT_1230266 [Mycena capillaripes]|nr:hypothetical protein B0H19DRAFT_1230266 [Mycena capillaripes]